MKHIFSVLYAIAFATSSQGQDGKISFTSDDQALVKGFCHPKNVTVAVSSDAQNWKEAGTIQHDDLWNPPGDYEPWEYDQGWKYSDLPAGGRLAYSFPLVFKEKPTARYVRFTCAPLEGKGFGLSELHVYDDVEVKPWPAEIWLPSVAMSKGNR